MSLLDMLRPGWGNERSTAFKNLERALEVKPFGRLIPESLDNGFYLNTHYIDDEGNWQMRPATDEEISIWHNEYLRVKDEHGKTLLMRRIDVQDWIDDDSPERKVLEE